MQANLGRVSVGQTGHFRCICLDTVWLWEGTLKYLSTLPPHLPNSVPAVLRCSSLKPTLNSQRINNTDNVCKPDTCIHPAHTRRQLVLSTLLSPVHSQSKQSRGQVPLPRPYLPGPCRAQRVSRGLPRRDWPREKLRPIHPARSAFNMAELRPPPLTSPLVLLSS